MKYFRKLTVIEASRIMHSRKSQKAILYDMYRGANRPLIDLVRQSLGEGFIPTMTFVAADPAKLLPPAGDAVREKRT